MFSRISERFVKKSIRTRYIMQWNPPEKIETLFASTSGNKFASINAPTAGARAQVDAPKGSAPIQLYSLATPNGQKAAIMLEELGVDYDAHVIDIGRGDQFNSGFVSINPNSKIPAMIDTLEDGKSVNVFESGSIVLYLAEKYHRFLPTSLIEKTEVMNWVFWQMAGQGPMTGNFGHFMVYAPSDKVETRNYGVARYGMEVQRLCDVLDKHLEAKGTDYIVGNEYTIADIMCFPWFHQLRIGYKHSSGIDAKQFLSTEQYHHLNRWADRILQRPAVQRGITVCNFQGIAKPWLEVDNKKEQ